MSKSDILAVGFIDTLTPTLSQRAKGQVDLAR